MKKIAASFLLLLVLETGSLHALNLTPNVVMSDDEGPAMRRYFFEDEGKRLSFRVGASTNVNGSADAVAFRFDDLQRAAMKISHSSMNPGIPFDEKNLAAYRNSARALLGPEAANVQIDGEILNPIFINRWTSYQFRFTYEQFGMQHRRSITFLNYSEKEQLIIDVNAVAEDYAKGYARGYQVLNSMTTTSLEKSGPT